MIPTSIDGTDITGATIDGTDVQEITVDGDVVFSAGPDIPDAGDLRARYDFSLEDGTTPVTDQTGNGHNLSGTYSGVSTKTINGVQAGYFDGNDLLQTTWPNVSEPYHIFVVGRFIGVEQDIMFDGASSDEHFLEEKIPNEGTWQISNGNRLQDGTADLNDHVFTFAADGSFDRLRVDGTQVISGNAGTSDSTGFTLGGRGDGTNRHELAIGEVLFYPQDKSSIELNVESYLTNKWGPF